LKSQAFLRKVGKRGSAGSALPPGPPGVPRAAGTKRDPLPRAAASARQEGPGAARGGGPSPLAPLALFSLGITWDYHPDFVATEHCSIPLCREPLENLLSSSLETAGSSVGSELGSGEGSFGAASPLLLSSGEGQRVAAAVWP